MLLITGRIFLKNEGTNKKLILLLIEKSDNKEKDFIDIGGKEIDEFKWWIDNKH